MPNKKNSLNPADINFCAELFELPTAIIDNKGKIHGSNVSFNELLELKFSDGGYNYISDYISNFNNVKKSLSKNGNIVHHNIEFFKPKKFQSWVTINKTCLSQKDLYILTIHNNGTADDIQGKSKIEELIESVNAVFWRANPGSFQMTYVSKQAESFLGYPREQWTTDPSFWQNHIYEPDREWVINYCITETKAGRPHDFEYRMVKKDGEVIWIKDTVRYITKNGKIIEILGLLVNINKEKKVIENLENYQFLLEEAQHMSHIGSFEWDIVSNKVTWSDELYRIYGIKPGKFKATFESFLEMVHPEDKEKIRDSIEKAFKDGGEFSSEERIIRPDKKIRHLLTKGKFLKDKTGEPIRLIGVCQDVTERKEYEEALKKETLYVELLKSIAIAANESESIEEAIDFCLQKVCEKTQFSLGHAYLVSAEDKNLLEPTKFWYLKDEEKFSFFKRKTQNASFKTGIGLPGRVLKTKKTEWINDIEKDDNFSRSEEALKSGIVSGFAFPFFTDNKIVGVLEFFSDTKVKLDEKLMEIMTNIGTQLGRVIDRKNSTDALKNSEEKFRALSETANDAIISADTRSNIIYFNKGAESVFGYSKDEVLNKQLTLLMPQKYRDLHYKGISRFMKTGEGKVIGRTIELEGLRKDGTVFPIDLSLASWRAGDQVYFTAMIRDITERKKFINSLRNKAKQQSAIAELGQLAITESDIGNIFKKAVDLVSKTLNVEYAKILELQPGREKLLLKEGVGWKKGLVGNGMVSAGLKSQAGYTLKVEHQVIVKDLRKEKRFSGPPLLHEHKVISGLSVPIPGIDKPYGVLGAHSAVSKDFDKDDIFFLQAIANILATSIDKIKAEAELRLINEKLRNTRRELIHSEKLAALGRFSSNIAHEIRNPLANISASTQFVLAKFKPDQKIRKHLRLMLRNANTADRIIRELLDFASPRGIKLEPADIATIINEIYNLVIARCRKHNIQIKKSVQDDLPEVMINKEKLEEAFQNFISNSIEAMPAGGKINIKAKESGGNILISFEDTGEGIPSESIDNILEPFFTTKTRGTGLGLSLAHQIIKSHNGSLNISSNVGKGTTIEVTLPVIKKEND